MKSPPKSTPNNATHVISVNNKQYVPITNKTVKPIVIVNTTFVPVYTAPKNKVDTLIPITPKKEGPVETFSVGKVTYIPKDIIPKTS